jgi:hypothetical protein
MFKDYLLAIASVLFLIAFCLLSGFALGVKTTVYALKYEKVYAMRNGKKEGFYFRFYLGPFSYDLNIEERPADNTDVKFKESANAEQ